MYVPTTGTPKTPPDEASTAAPIGVCFYLRDGRRQFPPCCPLQYKICTLVLLYSYHLCSTLFGAAANADIVYMGATLSGEVFCTLTTALLHHVSSYISKHKPTSLERAHFRPDRPRYPSQDSTMLAYDTHPLMDVSATADGKLGYTTWQRDAFLSCQATTNTATLSTLKLRTRRYRGSCYGDPERASQLLPHSDNLDQHRSRKRKGGLFSGHLIPIQQG